MKEYVFNRDMGDTRGIALSVSEMDLLPALPNNAEFALPQELAQ